MLFSSFLFTPVQSGYGRYLLAQYMGFSAPSNEWDWLAWLNELFLPHQHLHALDQAIEEQKRSIDIWVTLPYPDPQQTKFGRMSGSALNFQSSGHRLKAVQWWIRAFVKKWRNHRFRHPLRLRGFRWPREVLVQDDEPLVQQVSRELKAHGLQFMWLSQYGANHVQEWRRKGFDVTLIHPGYYGRTDTPVTYIDYAAAFASVAECGLQMVCGNGFLFDQNHPYAYWNRGLPEQQGYLNKALLLFVFQETDLYELARTRPTVYRDLVQVVRGIRERQVM